VGPATGGVGVQRIPVLFWKVGSVGRGGSAGANPRQFGSTSDNTIYAFVLFPRPAIPWKCELVRSREDSLPNRVLAVLISSC
jgi:hypothetical protein